jgi:uncharacterized protein YjbI with pentapeptide repeats
MIHLLPQLPNSEFAEFHSRLFLAAKFTDLSDLVQVARIQKEILSDMVSSRDKAAKDLENAQADDARKLTGAASRMAAAQSRLDDANGSLSRLDETLRIVGADMALALRQKPISATPDLSSVEVFTADFTGVDFGSSDLTGAKFEGCNFSNADLSKIKAIDRSYWSQTEWWLAKAISPELLRYLKDKAPFDSSSSYYGPPATQKEYEQRLAALSH